MKQILLLTFLLFTANLFSQWNTAWMGNFTILPTSDSPYNQFTTLSVEENTISIQLDGVNLHRFEWVENVNTTNFIVKCVLDKGQTPNSEWTKMRFNVQIEEHQNAITVHISYKNVHQTINLQRL